MFKRRIKLLLSSVSLTWLIAVTSLVLLLFLLPWNIILGTIMPPRVIGIEGAFVAGLFLMPCLIGLLLFWYCKRADDLERHMRKYENE